MLLPRPKRLALTALYAFARRVDDIADGSGAAEERRQQLHDLRAALQSLPHSPGEDAVLVALADTLVRYPVPRRALLDLIEGALWDVDRTRYESWEELREYCRRVAGAIGISCTAVYGPADPERARPLAETLGLALQQINIMRDVGETGGSDACTSRRTSWPASAFPARHRRGPHGPGLARPDGPPGLAGTRAPRPRGSAWSSSSTRGARCASGRSQASTRDCSTRSSAASTTSSPLGRACRRWES